MLSSGHEAHPADDARPALGPGGTQHHRDRGRRSPRPRDDPAPAGPGSRGPGGLGRRLHAGGPQDHPAGAAGPARHPKLDTPIDDGHGGQYTERVDQIVCTARTPLPDALRDTFELSLKLPEKEGAKLVFPAVQKCEKGETPWTEVAEGGAEEPEHPAPYIVLTAKEAPHGAATPTPAETATPAAPASAGDVARVASDSAASSGSGDPGLVGWAGLALGAVGAAAGVTALVRGRKTSCPVRFFAGRRGGRGRRPRPPWPSCCWRPSWSSCCRVRPRPTRC
ncbi:DUF1775 domain-containing protein [Streptosporangium sp. NPDC002721]|uniref:DUF1775 domain-containing protein n=1 Tax=Streptosporangium sp. NPDC002721 TaxID=3366188 RepID=UPI0036CA6C5C